MMETHTTGKLERTCPSFRNGEQQERVYLHTASTGVPLLCLSFGQVGSARWTNTQAGTLSTRFRFEEPTIYSASEWKYKGIAFKQE